MSDSLRPHGLQHARLLCPWDFPGKNSGVGWHFLYQGIFPTKGLNPCLWLLLRWQADSLLLRHLGSSVWVCKMWLWPAFSSHLLGSLSQGKGRVPDVPETGHVSSAMCPRISTVPQTTGSLWEETRSWGQRTMDHGSLCGFGAMGPWCPSKCS